MKDGPISCCFPRNDCKYIVNGGGKSVYGGDLIEILYVSQLSFIRRITQLWIIGC